MNEFQNLYETIKETTVTIEDEVCSTCTKKCFAAIKITDLDYDGRSFLEKLKACVCPSLEVDSENVPKICRPCITTLNLSFKFRKTALHSLRSLKYISGRAEDNNQELDEIKDEPDYSEDELSLSNDNEFITNELQNAVFLISQMESENKKNELELSCERCSINFGKKSEYDYHMSQVHEKNISCEICGKAFRTTYKLKHHMASHIGEKSYSCTNCDKSFTRMSSLKRHMKAHYAPPGQKSKKTPFLCNICGKNFPFSNGATRHMRIHFGIKTHECEICHRQFNQSTHLQVHMRTHSGEKPYICEICGDSFSLRAGLLKHSRAKHKEDGKNETTLENAVFSN
ncbi:zinc finger protein 613-like [Harmonia axyridis]|uniref:zinc finger protein 613-like n=1 Tax=Harmonia axyridis TaxID=115357 RepID=UPI001E2794D8|nr:zinc finger protein 613-like [Harmonia axyridis]